MLTYSQLAELEQTARDAQVLNVYVNAGELDAVSRRSWRRTLANAIVATRKSLADAPHAERNAFERAAELLDDRVKQLADDMEGAAGWVAFVAPDRVLHAGPVKSPPPPLVEWRTGIAAAPYLRLDREDGDVIVALVDARSADVYRWSAGELERVDRLRSHAHLSRAAHMGDTPQQGFHSGTRGTALTDAAQRALDVGRTRMVHDLVNRLEALVKPDGWIVIAGIRTVTSDVLKHLGKTAAKRTLYLAGVSTDASEVDIGRAAVDGRARLLAAHQMEAVTELIDRSVSRRRGVLGPEKSLDALRTGAAREILISEGFFEQHAADAESIALEALAHGARVQEVEGHAALRLDGEAGGVGATLRFASRGAKVKAELAPHGEPS